jgi:uncharacterized membrane protein YphA (DoxX/SURF4 family)
MPATIQTVNSGTPLQIILWLAQFSIAIVFILSGFTKLATPLSELAKIMPWTGEYPMWFVRSIAVIDLAGGIGIILPALTRILPRLTVLAALGCIVLQVLAIGFHVSRGEAMVTPLNFALLGLSLLVWWGRARKAPILPRT